MWFSKDQVVRDTVSGVRVLAGGVFVVLFVLPTVLLITWLAVGGAVAVVFDPADSDLVWGLVTLPFAVGLAVGLWTVRSGPSDTVLVSIGTLLSLSALLALMGGYGIYWLPLRSAVLGAGVAKTSILRIPAWVRNVNVWRKRLMAREERR